MSIKVPPIHSTEADTNKSLQVSLNETKWITSMLPLKEFTGFMEYKDLHPQQENHSLRPKPLALSPKVKVSPALHSILNPILSPQPVLLKKAPVLSPTLFTSMNSDMKRLPENPMKKSPSEKLPLIIRVESPKKSLNNKELSEPKKCKRCSSLPKIAKNASHARSKSNERHHYKYTLERMKKYFIQEPRMPNIFANNKSPERIYEKVEYLSQLPPNPNFDITELDSRIEKLCKHSGKVTGRSQRMVFSQLHNKQQVWNILYTSVSLIYPLNQDKYLIKRK
eukprot:TRINITY_DN105020_c1_g1_i1.p4 TRINITY_DN105020_c1_g1~~TRINITY_DN105020_c1_g1_i1.p4  ORF type:complete len:280 (-),score=22.41 TRINITY_DN105020_c1_g1_i1:3855-4694(-)